MTFKTDCTDELKAACEVLLIDSDTYFKALEIIENEADKHEHMKVSEFVDMCLDIARVKE